MPLVGVFTAKISKGRKLKEIAFGLLVLCSIGCWISMATLGNFVIDQEMSGAANIAVYLDAGDEAGAVIAAIFQTPFPKVLLVFLLVIMLIFLATTMDSSAYSAAEMSVERISGTEEDGSAPRWLRLLWAGLSAIVAFAVVQVGGAMAVRSLCYAAGLPLAIVAILIIFAAVKMLRNDDPGSDNDDLFWKIRTKSKKEDQCAGKQET